MIKNVQSATLKRTKNFREPFQVLILKGKKMPENLVTLDKIREIINKELNIVKFEGSIGTEESILGSPYQVVRLEIIYTTEEKNDKEDS